MSNPMNKAIEQYLERRGLSMRKELNAGGLFSSPTYDRRTVYSREDLNRLNSEGFLINVDMGIWLLNAFSLYQPQKPTRKAK